MELRTPCHYRLSILCHLAIQQLRSVEIFKIDGIEITSAQTATTTHTILLIDRHLASLFIEYKAIICTLCQALFTTTTQLCINYRLTADVLLGLSCS